MHSFNSVQLVGKNSAESSGGGACSLPLWGGGVYGGQVGTRCLAAAGLGDEHMEQPLLVPLTHFSVLKGVI